MAREGQTGSNGTMDVEGREGQGMRMWKRVLSRRKFITNCAATASLLSWSASAASAESTSTASDESRGAEAAGAQHARAISLDSDWLFGGKASAAALAPEFDDQAFAHVTLPHCAVPLSWQKWDPQSWEDVWIYRRRFSVPRQWRGLRLFLHFDRVMAAAAPVLNGRSLDPHLGGFLPFEREITGLTNHTGNVLALSVDARWLNAPPSGSPRGPRSVDYLLPGGVTGSVRLKAAPDIYLREVFAKPVDVLDPSRRMDVTCQVNAAAHANLPAAASLTVRLLENGRAVAQTTESVHLKTGDSDLKITLGDLKQISLWDTDRPHLYGVEVTLSHGGKVLDRSRARIGFRDARFELDGFFLNGRRTQIFGLNRHELYPYVGFATPARLHRRDAEILKRKLNCNAVRCSHYPQSEAFLDACDELGLMVWEELPGWQYIGDESWQALAVRDVESMIRRDRNHPAIIVWGVRVNESHNDVDLYRRTRALAHSLDDSRQASGTMTTQSTAGWSEDVFSFDDYHATPDRTVGIDPPVPGVPYLISECVGQYNYRAGKGFNIRYRRAEDPRQQMDQAIFHAQAHSRAAGFDRCSGVIAWCGFDYASLMNAYDGVKCPGVYDLFRLPKLGASFYRAQADPAVQPVIEPNFYWEFGVQSPQGPGKQAAIFSNCDRLKVFIAGKLHAAIEPDRAGYPHLKHPPFFADFNNVDGAAHPGLRIDGYVGASRVLSRSFSSDTSADRLWVQAEDEEIEDDGIDMTRVAFAAVDRFGAQRLGGAGAVTLALHGPAILVGDNPFSLDANGGAGAVYVKSLSGTAGAVRVTASHPSLGKGSAQIIVSHAARRGLLTADNPA
jgi:beta-galactosidase